MQFSKKIDRNAFSVVSGFDEADDDGYWHALSPAERLNAVEFMRQILYGYDPFAERLQRFFEIAERP